MKEAGSKKSLIALSKEVLCQPIQGKSIERNRDGDPTHTIAYIKTMGGEDLYDKNMNFMFQTERDFFECIHNLPGWSRRIPSMPDIAKSLKINCNFGEYR
ncbi:unnamed protein product [Rhizophagus irregularis]|uniref:Uncharacterized protein n=1 Tax=Rhizophagus irregularis TaxID=588596 RepID=A0A916A0M7_9GLOM|nr:unnamed protein product [Rhizophagus irregularis]CAB5394323.1 unnamed protein product [Rhizophagus irregularis]